MKQWHWYVYVLECKDGLYYTGMTYNIDNRMSQHSSGKSSGFTSRHGYGKLRYVEEFTDINDARAREAQIKDFSRKKKEVLWENR